MQYLRNLADLCTLTEYLTVLLLQLVARQSGSSYWYAIVSILTMELLSNSSSSGSEDSILQAQGHPALRDRAGMPTITGDGDKVADSPGVATAGAYEPREFSSQGLRGSDLCSGCIMSAAEAASAAS